MSRLSELKKEYPQLNISFFDLLVRMDTTKSYKYLALLCKLFSRKFDLESEYSNSTPEDRAKMTLEMHSSLISRHISTNGLNEKEVSALHKLSDFWNSDSFTIINEFINHIEDGRIPNKDVTSYNSFKEIRSAVSLATVKELDKVLENQVIKEYEDDKWVIVRPLTFQASAKYGASTRWCTTYQKEKEYFERYWRSGVLVYFINKQTGYKFAGYKGIEEMELSFWSAEDHRVDFLSIDIDDYLFSIVKKIFSSNKTNKNLSSNEIQDLVHKECLREENKFRIGGDPQPILMVDPHFETPYVEQLPPIVQMTARNVQELQNIIEDIDGSIPDYQG